MARHAGQYTNNVLYKAMCIGIQDVPDILDEFNKFAPFIKFQFFSFFILYDPNNSYLTMRWP